MSNPEEKIQILVVDDSPVYRKLVEQVLSAEPCSLLFAKSGHEALDLYAQHSPSIVITDWMMPDFSGLELCQKIRADRQRYTYIILLTSISEKGNVVKGLAAGADDYLTKPFDPGELLARIGVGRRIIGLQREIEAKTRLLEEAARTDFLTGLPNRRGIEEWTGRLLHGAARHGFSIWVVLADLDFFKWINDSYGHSAGDTVLQKFAEIVKANTRASDICGRLGGDEFILVITHVDRANVGLMVDRLRQQLAAEVFRFDGGVTRITASFGIAGFQGKEAPNFGDVLRRADKTLYAAKGAGRNQVKIEAE
jgi:two-component system cell cycle response regulator